MPRRASVSYALFLLAGCGASQAPARAAPPLLVATGDAPVTVADVTGQWSGPEWGRVVLNADGTGTYTDTYGTGPGRIALHAAGDGYDGRWEESSRRFGTLHIVLSPSGREITGTWTPDPECTLGAMRGGALRWTRE